MRVCLLLLGLIASGAGRAAAPFVVISDELDPDALVSTLPAGPVDQMLDSVLEQQPRAKVLVPRRLGTQADAPYALAAWRAEPEARAWDAMLVLALPKGARLIEASSESRDVEATLAALLAYAVGSPTPLPTVAAKDRPLPMPERFDTRYLVLFERVPGYAPGDAAAEEALTQRHIQYQLRMQAQGVSVAAGPFREGSDPSSPERRTRSDPDPAASAGTLVGATILRAHDLAAARALAEADPAVLAGRLKAIVREWSVPAGRLP